MSSITGTVTVNETEVTGTLTVDETTVEGTVNIGVVNITGTYSAGDAPPEVIAHISRTDNPHQVTEDQIPDGIDYVLLFNNALI